MACPSKKKRGRPSKPPETPEEDEATHHLLNRRKSVLGMLIEKLKYEKQNLTSLHSLAQSQRKNISLQIENLKLKEDILKQEIVKLKSEISKWETIKKDRRKSMNNSTTAINDSAAQIKAEDLHNTTKSPYLVMLVSDGPSYENNDRRRFYVDSVLDLAINQFFELISEDPFKIAPLDNDVVLRYDYVEQLRPSICKYATNVRKDIARLSIKHNELTSCAEVVVETGVQIRSSVIDLTDEESAAEVQKKSGLESRESQESQESRESQEILGTRPRSPSQYNYTGSQLPSGHFITQAVVNANVRNHVEAERNGHRVEDKNASVLDLSDDVIEIS